MSAMTRMIKEFCERTGSEFVGYYDGLYQFKTINGITRHFTQSELRNIVKKF